MDAPGPMPPLTPDHYHRAVQLCARVVDAAHSDDGGPTVAGSFLGQLAELLDPVDEKGRGPSYWRGFADGRLAERADAGWPESVTAAWARGLYRGGGDPATMGRPPQLPSGAVSVGDEPPFAPELADAPLVTGESGAPAPLVVDHPVHESTLPAELSAGLTVEVEDYSPVEPDVPGYDDGSNPGPRR